MAFFKKLFEKESCAFCGKEIGIFGKKKLEDGVMCGECQKKLSPWFSDRRNSTIAEIQEQLDYREANKAEVAAFRTTRSFGSYTKILLDEDNQKFMVTSARDLEEANPDVLSFSDVTGCTVDVDESVDEEKKTNAEGKEISYIPPRYTYSYDFDVVIPDTDMSMIFTSQSMFATSTSMRSASSSIPARWRSKPLADPD